jgi:hypothetical protein
MTNLKAEVVRFLFDIWILTFFNWQLDLGI